MPYQDAPDPPVDDALRERAAHALYVLRPDGDPFVGARGVLHVNATVGGLLWRLLRAAFWYPPAKWLADLGYRVVASNRSFFARFLYRDPDPADPPTSDE